MKTEERETSEPGTTSEKQSPKQRSRNHNNETAEATKEEIKQITMPEKMTIRELADKMKIAPAAIVKKLFIQGTMVTVNHEIDYDTAEEIAMEYTTSSQNMKKSRCDRRTS